LNIELNGITADDKMADIFTEDLGLTPVEMIILETFFLDTIDLALNANDDDFALEIEEALIDLHALKLRYLAAGGQVGWDGILQFWDVTIFPGRGLAFAVGPSPSEARRPT
jgi:hypothetical protein